jgi:hypothetical protein
MNVLEITPLAIVLYVIVFGLIGTALGQRKGRPFAGFVFGALVGPIGWLIIAAGPDAKANGKCPFCAEAISPEAIICKHCGKEIANIRTRKEVIIKFECPACSQPMDGSTELMFENVTCPACSENFYPKPIKTL